LLIETLGASQWTSHIKQQPQTYGNTLYFSQADLDQLKGSNLAQIAVNLLQQVQEDYQALFPKMLTK
jgi:hypothetical protein